MRRGYTTSTEMNGHKTQLESFSRREFVVVAGLFFAGTLVSCSGDDEKQPEGIDSNPIEKNILALPNSPPVIRVRVGKIRGRNTTKIGDTEVSRSSSKWYTSGYSPAHKNNGTTITFDSLEKCNVFGGGRTKAITGKIDLIAREDLSSDAFDVVATVPIEQYLPGVLAGELYAHWHPATFAAQAIAARSYAVAHHLQRIRVSHFDVSDDTSSQVFLGDVTLDVAHRAVKETSGMVLSWKGTVVPAYYSACCGGLAATAIDAISNSTLHNISPLVGHDGNDVCTSVDIHKWAAQRDSRVLRKRLNACSESMQLPELATIHSIRSIEPSMTNKHGRPNRLAIIDRRRNLVEMRARDFVRAANTNVAPLPKPTPTIWSSFLVGKKMGAQIQFDGFGLGHGVGLCQYGAQELAGRGRTFEEILAWYYPNAELHTFSRT